MAFRGFCIWTLQIHTHTHTCSMGTLHWHNDFYVVQYILSP